MYSGLSVQYKYGVYYSWHQMIIIKSVIRGVCIWTFNLLLVQDWAYPGEKIRPKHIEGVVWAQNESHFWNLLGSLFCQKVGCRNFMGRRSKYMYILNTAKILPIFTYLQVFCCNPFHWSYWGYSKQNWRAFWRGKSILIFTESGANLLVNLLIVSRRNNPSTYRK